MGTPEPHILDKATWIESDVLPLPDGGYEVVNVRYLDAAGTVLAERPLHKYMPPALPQPHPDSLHAMIVGTSRELDPARRQRE
jgi:hypothetical protein